MGTHEKAWEGLNILIYGNKDLIPMELEQNLAKASPANECKIDSFETYEDALEFSKTVSNVGIIFILEEGLKNQPRDVFRELSRPYSSLGWPTMGCLFHPGSESFTGLRAIQTEPNLIAYEDINETYELGSCKRFLERFWRKFSERFSSEFLGRQLRESIISEFHIEHFERYQFASRLVYLVSENINLSWKELTAINWRILLDPVLEKKTKLLDPHPVVRKFVESVSPGPQTFDYDFISDKKNNLASRTLHLITRLSEDFEKGTLDDRVEFLQQFRAPRSPALLKNLARKPDSLRNIASTVMNSQKKWAS